MLTSAWQTRWKCPLSFLFYTEGVIASCTVVDAHGVDYVLESCRNLDNLVYGGASKLETHLCGNDNFRLTNEVAVLIIISSYTQVVISCWTVADARYWNWRHFSLATLTSASHTTLMCWWSYPSEMQGLRASCSVPDARLVENVSVSVSVLMWILKKLLHSCKLNWTLFWIHHSSSASPRKLIPVDHGSPYTDFRVEDWGCRHCIFRVKAHSL